jgi:hypothetical protein
VKGRCYCGGIKYEITPPTKMFSHCHCESCRRSHGAAFVSWTSVANEQFKITSGAELISNYESSPGIIWQFCKICGASIFQKTRHSPDITYVVAASLIDSIDREAEGHMSFEEKVPWLEISDDLPKHREKTSDLIGSQ